MVMIHRVCEGWMVYFLMLHMLYTYTKTPEARDPTTMQNITAVKGLKHTSQQGTNPTSHSVRQIGVMFEWICESERS